MNHELWIKPTRIENLKVAKLNSLIEAKYKLSKNEQKLILLLISQLGVDDEDFKPIRFKVADIHKFLGLKKETNYTYLKCLTENLLSKVLKIYDPKKNSLLQINWLSSAEYFVKEGIIELQFDPKLKPFLLKLKKNFTQYYLKIAIRFDSGYSIRLYELLKQYENIGKRIMAVSELKELLWIPKQKYKKYHDFKKRVILKAQKELFEKADIFFDFVEEKKWKKIERIIFLIKKNKKFLINVEDKDYNTENEDIINLIKRYTDLTDKQIKDIFQKYSKRYIITSFNEVFNKHKEGKVKNISAFFLSTLKEGFFDDKINKLKIEEDEKKQYKLGEEIEKELKKLNTKYLLTIFWKISEKFEKLKEDKKNFYKKDFIENFVKKNILIEAEFKHKHFKSQIIQNLFLRFLADKQEFNFWDYNIIKFLKENNFNLEKIFLLKEKYRGKLAKNLVNLIKLEKKLAKLGISSGVLFAIDLETDDITEKLKDKVSINIFNELKNESKKDNNYLIQPTPKEEYEILKKNYVKKILF